MTIKRPEITHWNYRVLTEQWEDPSGSGEHETTCKLIEVYYCGDEIVAWGEAAVLGDSPASLAQDLRRMAQVADLATLKSEKRRALTLDDLPASPPTTKDAQ